MQLQDYFDLLADTIEIWRDVIDGLNIRFAGIHITFYWLLGGVFVAALIRVLIGDNSADDDELDPLSGYQGDDWE